MRAVTLSDSQVRSLLSDRFVCAWTDTEGDANAGGSFAHRPKDPAPQCLRGNGEHNVQVLMLTPRGELLNVLAGYVGPKEMAEELEFALRAWQSLRGADGVGRADRLVTVQKARIDALGSAKEEGPLGDWEKRRRVEDHRFVVDHPLLAAGDFRPEDLVGRGQSFFGSSNDEVPKGGIGDDSARKALDDLMKGASQEK